jgi:hypothetical protein
MGIRAFRWGWDAKNRISATSPGPNPRGPAPKPPPPPPCTAAAAAAAAGRALGRRGHAKPLARHCAKPRAEKNWTSATLRPYLREQHQSPLMPCSAPRPSYRLPCKSDPPTPSLQELPIAAPRPPLPWGHAKTASVTDCCCCLAKHHRLLCLAKHHTLLLLNPPAQLAAWLPASLPPPPRPSARLCCFTTLPPSSPTSRLYQRGREGERGI